MALSCSKCGGTSFEPPKKKYKGYFSECKECGFFEDVGNFYTPKAQAKKVGDKNATRSN